MLKILYLILILGIISSCTTLPQNPPPTIMTNDSNAYSPQLAVLENYIQKTVTEKDYQTIAYQLEEEIVAWIDYYTNTAIFTDNDYEISKKLIFNDKKTEVVVLITVQLSYNNDGRVKIITGKKKAGKWDFTLTGMNYHYATDVPYSRTKLEDKTLHKMALEGLVENKAVQQERIHTLVNMWN